MNNKIFKERLEEILNTFGNKVKSQASWMNLGGEPDNCGEEATQQLTQLFQDFKDTVIGEEETQLWDDEWSACTKCDYQPEGSKECLCVINNKLRQTQHQTANLILKKEE